MSLMTENKLRERVRNFVANSMAGNSQNKYSAQWAAFERFCAQRNYPALPAHPDAIVDYLTLLATAGRRVATVELAMAAITYVHRANDLPNPRDSAHVRTVLRGIRRSTGVKPVRKSPVLRDELIAVLNAQGDDLRGIRNRAILLVGWMGAFRRSELMALDVDDVAWTKSGATVTVVRSKTDQEGAGLIKQLPFHDDANLCAARALRYWLNASEIESGALFRAIDRWGKLREGYMDGREVARLIKSATAAAGLDARQFSGHSLRAGFVTAAAENGAAKWQIAEQTGHKPGSPVLDVYIRSAGRGAKSAVQLALGGQ